MELVGKAEIIDDPDRLWPLGVSVFERYYGEFTDDLKPMVEAMVNKRVAIKMHVERTVSWDHRKLGLPSTRPGAGAGAGDDADLVRRGESRDDADGRRPARPGHGRVRHALLLRGAHRSRTTSRCSRSCGTRTPGHGS